MIKRRLSHVAIALSFTLTFGPGLSLAPASNGDEGRNEHTPGAKPAPKAGPGAKFRKLNFAARVQASALLPGQASTLLPDGRTLLTGGEGADGPLAEIAVSDARTGEPAPLPNKLRLARAWHSATMLPDGRVLIFGGVGTGGRLLDGAEILDPDSRTSEPLASAGLSPRAFHTATLLTDGRVLIVGGVSGGGRMVGRAALLDFKLKKAVTTAARLSAERHKHTATLLADGSVLIEGGVDGYGNRVAAAELYNVEDGSFNFTVTPDGVPADGVPYLAASSPADGASDVPADSLLALRFSKRLRVESLNTGTLTLNGPEGAVETRVVPAENGRLAFITPKKQLLAGVTYTVTVTVTVDEAGQQLSPAAFSFTTKEEQESVGAGPDEEDWVPDAKNFHGEWRSKLKDSPWRSLPLLQAEEGVTALAGQVLTLDGRPLKDVTLRAGGATVRTDKTGRFLLAALEAGHHVMVIDGRSASRPNRAYAIFRVGVDVTEGRTNALGYTVWMPKLDKANATTIPSPTRTATTVTNPRIPGLELRLPSGTVIRDLDGRNVTQVSITPIPTDRPPFPLPPNVDVPIYFTIQPGGSQIIPPRAQLVYPNFIGSRPGERIDFYNYDPTGKGWYVYGQGTVTADGRQIVPDPGVVLYEFSGAMVALPSLAPSTFVPCGAGTVGGYSVDLGTGLFIHEETDVSLRGLGATALTRTYRPGDTRSRAFGVGATHNYDIFLVGDTSPATYLELIMPDGGRVHFDRTSPGTGLTDAVYEQTSCASSCFFGSTISLDGNVWELNLRDGSQYTFPLSGMVSRPALAALIGFRDRLGNAVSIVRDGASNLSRVTAASGRWIEFTYDASNRVTQARDNIGRLVNYTYDTSGRLWRTTDVLNGVREYTYDASHSMFDVKDARGIIFPRNEYDSAGRVIKQILADDTPDNLADNPFYLFAYTVDSGGRVTQTDVTDPRGNVRRVTFNASGYTVSETYPQGKPEQRAVTYERQEGSNRIVSITDSLGRKVAYTYDTYGRMTETTSLAGTPESVTTRYGYAQGCSCDDVTSVTDPLNHTTMFDYDDNGRLTGITDANNNKTTFTHNLAGQPLSAIDALNNTLQFTYDNGDLVSVTDPKGQTTSSFVDGAGRMTGLRTPVGLPSRFEYDALNRPVKATDPVGGVTEFTYDANGNLLNVKDARNNITSYTYDSMNRLTSRTDPLQLIERYEYDEIGNLKKFTDRRGKVTSYVYDNFYRVTLIGFGTVENGGSTAYESTINYTYDAAGRLEQAVDSVSGSVSYTYDNFNRVISKTAPQGVISYTYDGVGRRTSMTVAGQATVSYTYDNSDRLTQITQGTVVVSFTYDSANRLTTMSQTNGITVEYGYDQTSYLTSITYKKGATVLGDLIYEYDGVGKRTKTGGSFARTGLPQALTSTVHNGANQLTQRDGTYLTYDANGNLTGDGLNTYNWNARNQLTSISGQGLTASFQYDAAGNRVGKTVNGVAINYLYDGLNVVQELSGTTPITNLLNGGVDKTLARTDGGGTRTPLMDGLGSTLALADNTGTLQTQYTYDPFGNTVTSGTFSTNTSKYTGRDEDGTGLYYYRARYYSPKLQRFISEDPAEFSGGDMNLYAYVGNDPVNFIDPLGLCGVSSQQTFPPVLQGNPTTQQVAKFNAAYVDAVNRILDRPACARLFGGRAKALKALSETQYRFEALGDPLTSANSVADAETRGNSIVINSQGAFMLNNGRLPGDRYRRIPEASMIIVWWNETSWKIIELGELEKAAFILLHELGHRRKIYGKYDNDGDDIDASVRNNRKVWEACFK